MFSGIVEGTGKLLKFKKQRSGAQLTLSTPFSLSGSKIGASVAVNGCCLTVTKKRGREFETDLSHETLRVTNLGKLKKGDLVNLERPMRLGDRIDGHLVQGHVDGVGKILSIKKVGESTEIAISLPKLLRRYLISKGSITLDGISLTINHLSPRSLTLVVIPHTLQVTNLKLKRVGDIVNLEVDMVGKYIESLSGK